MNDTDLGITRTVAGLTAVELRSGALRDPLRIANKTGRKFDCQAPKTAFGKKSFGVEVRDDGDGEGEGM